MGGRFENQDVFNFIFSHDLGSSDVDNRQSVWSKICQYYFLALRLTFINVVETREVLSVPKN